LQLDLVNLTEWRISSGKTARSEAIGFPSNPRTVSALRISRDFVGANTRPDAGHSSACTAAQQTKSGATVSFGKDEITSHEAPATLQVRVNLVLVRAVVRDPLGKAVTNLKKEDFQLTDDRKPQTISSFTVETPASHVTEVATNAGETEATAGTARTVQLPQRFIALFFDDRHLQAADVLISQRAARNLFTDLQPTDRFAIFSTSGQIAQDFTADRKKLEDSLQRIGPRGLSSQSGADCPPMSFYEA
jgi:hypothetical protein